MSILFLMSMFFLSFMPLWICIVCIDMKSLIDGTDYPYTEWIGLGMITFLLFVSKKTGNSEYWRIYSCCC